MAVFERIIKIVFKGDSKSATAASKQVETQLKKAEKQATKTASGMRTIGKAVAAAFSIEVVRRVGSAVWELSKLGARVEQLNVSFQAMAAKHGVNAVKVMKDMEKAAGGLMTQSQLLETANRSMALGIPVERMGDLIKVSRQAARVMGTDVGFMVESLSVGLGRQSRMMLDNLGIILSVEEAQRRYAEQIGKTVDQLTDQDKRLAYINIGLEKAGETFSNINLEAKSAADQLQQLETRWSSLKERLGTMILPVTIKVVTELDDFLKSRAEFGKALARRGVPFTATEEEYKMIAGIPPVSAKEGETAEAREQIRLMFRPQLRSEIRKPAPRHMWPTEEQPIIGDITTMGVQELETGLENANYEFERLHEGASMFENMMLGMFINVEQGFGKMIANMIKMWFGSLIARIFGGLMSLVLGGLGAPAWLFGGNIPWLQPKGAQTGGIVTAPTLAMVGEGGYKEAIVPLEGPHAKDFGRAIHLHFPYGVNSDEIRAGRKIARWIQKASDERYSTDL